jgi:hypothetical protein
LHAPYRALAAWGPLRRLVPEGLRPRVVAFGADGQVQLRLVCGRRVVGHYEVRRRQWQIRRPWRLVVDEAMLPRVVAAEEGMRDTDKHR